MPDYRAMYFHLAGAQTDAIESMVNTVEMLKRTHQEAEEMLLNSPEPNIVEFRPKDSEGSDDD